MASKERGLSLGIAVVFGLVFCRAGAAEETGAAWTDRPVRVDRSREIRERLPARASSDDDAARTTLRVEAFPRLGENTSFLAEGRRWRLAGVTLPDRDRICPGTSGPGWACGLRAWAEVSAFLAGKRLRCERAAGGDEAVPALDCDIRGRSVAETLVARGWLLPEAGADARLRAARAHAVGTRRGLAATAPP